jgi:hypothetical protein
MRNQPVYASIDFATKIEFLRAVRDGQPIVLYSPSLGMPAVNGTVHITGPWPLRDRAASAEEVQAALEQGSTALALAEETSRGGRKRMVRSARGKRLRQWTAEVMVKDMNVVAAR